MGNPCYYFVEKKLIMKTSAKSKHKKQLSPQKRRNCPTQNAYLHSDEYFTLSQSSQSKNLASSTQMLVSLSQTERFKLDFLISSYQELITMFKHQRKQFLETMKNQFQKHLFYYTQIISLAKTYQENTKLFLRSKLQDISNIFQLKISLIEMKLKNSKKLLFENVNVDSLFLQKKNKIKKSQSKKGLQVGKTSSYEDGLDFDEQLRQIYSQKNFRVNLNFIEMEEVQQSFQVIKTRLIKEWQSKVSQSVSFSSISNPQQSETTFRDICNDFESENEDHVIQVLKSFPNQRLQSQKTSTKYPYCSNETNTSSKQKPIFSSPISSFQLRRKQYTSEGQF